MNVPEKVHQLLHNTRLGLTRARNEFNGTKSMLFHDVRPAAEALYEAAPEQLRGYLKHLNLAEELIEHGMVHDECFRVPEMGRRKLHEELSALAEAWKGVVAVRFLVPDTTKEFSKIDFILLPPQQ